jgi:predicted PurR-regulated permease PerM
MKNFKRLYFAGIFFFSFFLLLFLLFLLRGIILPFLAAYVFAYILKPPVNYLKQHGVPHKIAAISVFIMSFLIFIFLFVFFLSSVLKEISSAQENMHNYTSSFISLYENLKIFISEKFRPFSFLLGTHDITQELSSYLNAYIMNIFKGLSSRLFSLFSLIMYLVIIPFASFFFLLDDQNIKKKIVGFVPNKYFETSLKILFGLNRQFGYLLTGMFISVVIFSVLSSLGLWAIGLKYPVLLGFFAGLFNLIPYLGQVAGILSAFAVCLVTGGDPSLFIYIILVFFTVNLIDNTLVQPLVMSKSANIHPLLVIFIVLAGSKIGGVFGMFLAIPFYSLFQVVFHIIYFELNKPQRPDFDLYKDSSCG